MGRLKGEQVKSGFKGKMQGLGFRDWLGFRDRVEG